MAALVQHQRGYERPPLDSGGSGSGGDGEASDADASRSSDDTVLSVGSERPTPVADCSGGGSPSGASTPSGPASPEGMCARGGDATGTGLKFSIDNILKADFGRRITDPIRRLKGRQNEDGETTAAVTAPVNLSKAEGGERAAATTNGESISGQPMLWPAWVYCTRYSDRPSSGRSPRTRRVKKSTSSKGAASNEEKRPRTAFSGAQLARLKHEFAENRYLTERRRQQLSAELGLNEAQIKIWFQNKRAKIKKASGQKNPLALQLMAQGLYNHSTIPLTKEEEELQEMHGTKSPPA